MTNSVGPFTVNHKFSQEFYFRETSYMGSFVKIKPSPNCNITLSFTDVGKSCHSRKFLTSQICLLTLFAKIKFLTKFPNLQYSDLSVLILKVNIVTVNLYEQN